jgi:phage tail protein X
MSRYDNTVYTVSERFDETSRRRIYDSVIDPTIPYLETDVYVRTTFGDRLDSLAFQYYSDTTLWWIIAAANPGLRKDSVFLEPNLQLRIPTDAVRVLQLIESQNNSR